MIRYYWPQFLVVSPIINPTKSMIICKRDFLELRCIITQQCANHRYILFFFDDISHLHRLQLLHLIVLYPLDEKTQFSFRCISSSLNVLFLKEESFSFQIWETLNISVRSNASSLKQYVFSFHIKEFLKYFLDFCKEL